MTTKYATLRVSSLPRYQGRRGAPFEGTPAWKRGRTAVISRPSASSYRTSTCLPSVRHPRCPPRLLSLTKRGLHYQAKQKGRELRQNEEERRPLRSSPSDAGMARPPAVAATWPLSLGPGALDKGRGRCAVCSGSSTARVPLSCLPPAMSRQRRWLALGALPPPAPSRGA